MMLLLWLAVIWLAGFGLVRWMFPQPVGWSLHNILLFSLGIGAGLGVASCVYFLALVLAGSNYTVLASAIGATAAIALALGLLARRRTTTLEWAQSPPVPWYVTALFVVAILMAVTTVRKVPGPSGTCERASCFEQARYGGTLSPPI
jgi:hypothetical protein